MAESTAIKVPDDIEYRVIANSLGFLIACGGLLAGTMVSERSWEYWPNDIVPLFLTLFMGLRLYRSFVTTMLAYQGTAPRRGNSVTKEKIQREHAIVAQLPHTANFTPEQVVEEVARRIEAQKAEAARNAGR
jgi:hypothetical protein